MKLSLRLFFEKLLSRESGIDPDLEDWYVLNFEKKIISYPKVNEKGVVERSWLYGGPIFESITIKEYFSRLGVLEIFLSNEQDKLIRMQYASVNPWGFVGYQIGESILFECGYYIPKTINVSPFGEHESLVKVYCGECNDPSRWKRGKKEEQVICNGEVNEIHTDTNRWEGEFTGKNGLDSFERLKTEDVQEKIIRDIVVNNLNKVSKELEKNGTSLSDVIEKNERISMSSIAAACHLSGWKATTNYLVTGCEVSDEIGTNITSYIEMFYGYKLFDDYLKTPDLE